MSDPFDCQQCTGPIYVRKPTDTLQAQLTLACSCQHVTVYRSTPADFIKGRREVIQRWGDGAARLVEDKSNGLWLDLEQWAKATARLAAASG